MKKYKYVGDGTGVPGLPNEVSDDQAAELGVLDILNAAIENGSYALTPSAVGEKAGKNKKGDVNNG
jgi:hypothetical protein